MTDTLYSPSGILYHSPHLGHTVVRSADGRRFRGQLQHVTDRGTAVMLTFAINDGVRNVHEGLVWAVLELPRLMLVWKAWEQGADRGNGRGLEGLPLFQALEVVSDG